MQVLISIQSLILVSEPYFNEPGFEGQLGTPQVRRLLSRPLGVSRLSSRVGPSGGPCVCSAGGTA